MKALQFVFPIAALVLLGACEMKVGKDKEGAATEQAASAEGQSEEGTISIDAPGFDMRVNLPAALRAQLGADGDILYPGAKFAALHVKADDGSGAGGSAELRFSTTDAPDKVAAWYRDPNQAKELTVASVEPDGNGYRIAGTRKGDSDPFTVSLQPASGGTDGVIVLRDRQGR